MPLVLGADVLLSYLFVDLRDVDSLELFVHLVKEEAEEVTCVLLLVVRVVDKQERLEDAFRVHNPRAEEPLGVKLVRLIKVFADVNELSQQAIFIKALLDVLVRSDRLQQVEKSRASEQRLKAHVHEAVDLLLVCKAFVGLGEVCH